LFLLFHLGLEFSLGRLLRAGYSIAMAGTIYIAINLTLRLLFGWVLGWPVHEILIVAGITTISSSAIVAKVIHGPEAFRSPRDWPDPGLLSKGGTSPKIHKHDLNFSPRFKMRGRSDG
jgi:hypothetical protein